MADSTFLSLGSVQFTHDEAPVELVMPSSQSLAIHDYIGGRRTIQALGVVWRPITWEGYLRDQNAFSRSAELDSMKSLGQIQRLSFLNYALDVVVQDYDPTIKHQWRIDYKITVQVVTDKSGKATVASTTTVDQQVSAARKNSVSAYNNLAGENTNVAA